MTWRPPKQLIFLLTFVFIALYVIPQIATVAAKGSFLVHATVQVGACGNGIVEKGEECDRGSTGGQTCDSLGHGKGELRCDASCSYDFSSCEDTTNPLFSAVVPYYSPINRCEAEETPVIKRSSSSATDKITASTKIDRNTGSSIPGTAIFFVAYKQQFGSISSMTGLPAGIMYLTGYG